MKVDDHRVQNEPLLGQKIILGTTVTPEDDSRVQEEQPLRQ